MIKFTEKASVRILRISKPPCIKVINYTKKGAFLCNKKRMIYHNHPCAFIPEAAIVLVFGHWQLKIHLFLKNAGIRKSRYTLKADWDGHRKESYAAAQ